jgi:hypothetical protein
MAVETIKFTELDTITSIDGDEIIAVADDPAGTPASKGMTIDELKQYIYKPGHEIYDTGYIEKVGWQSLALTITHGLNCDYEDLDITVIIAGDSTGNNASVFYSNMGDQTDEIGIWTVKNDSNSFILRTGSVGVLEGQGGGDGVILLDTETRHYRVIAVKRETKDLSNLYRAGWNSGWLDYSTDLTDITDNITHSLDTDFEDLNIDIYWSNVASPTNAEKYLVSRGQNAYDASSGANNTFGITLSGIDSNTLRFQTGANGILTIDSTGGNSVRTTGYIKIVITKKEFDSVLTVDHEVPHLSCSINTNLSLPNGVFTIFNPDVVYSSNKISNNNGVFTVEESGWYSFTMAFVIETSSWTIGKALEAAIFVNGVESSVLARHELEVTGNGYKGESGSKNIFLDEGDTVSGRIFHNATTDRTLLASAVYNTISIVKFADKFIASDAQNPITIRSFNIASTNASYTMPANPVTGDRVMLTWSGGDGTYKGTITPSGSQTIQHGGTTLDSTARARFMEGSGNAELIYRSSGDYWELIAYSDSVGTFTNASAKGRATKSIDGRMTNEGAVTKTITITNFQFGIGYVVPFFSVTPIFTISQQNISATGGTLVPSNPSGTLTTASWRNAGATVSATQQCYWTAIGRWY